MISVSQFYKEKFGCKVYKISLDASCTCPNRDGTKGTGGCIFCSASGSGDFAASRTKSIKEQIEEAKSLVVKKLNGKSGRSGKYIAYFQNFTNTYGDENRLESLYRQALSEADIAGLDIATRPDCLSADMLSRLSQLSKETFVTVELGLQTSNDNTAKIINRCYETSVYDKAVRDLHDVSDGRIHVVTHIIFGLPDENADDMIKSVSHALQCGTDGIKLTVLHVLKNTKLFEMYKEGKVKCLEKEEYFLLVARALDILGDNVVIHRLTGDGDKKILVAPLWTSNKRQVRNEMSAYLRRWEESQSKRESPLS